MASVVKVAATGSGNSGQTITVQFPAGTPRAIGGDFTDTDNGANVYSQPVIASGAIAADGQQATGWKATAASQANNRVLTVYVACAN